MSDATCGNTLDGEFAPCPLPKGHDGDHEEPNPFKDENARLQAALATERAAREAAERETERQGAQLAKTQEQLQRYFDSHGKEVFRADAAEKKLAEVERDLQVMEADCHDGSCRACARCCDAAQARVRELEGVADRYATQDEREGRTDNGLYRAARELVPAAIEKGDGTDG